jgi:transposase
MKADHSPIKGLTSVLAADIGKATAVLCDSRTGRRWTVANEPEVLRQALEPFADYELLVCEATGGYELALLDAALALGLPAHRADPLKVKRYIASLGGAAKTDDIDAGWLTRYGQERGASLALWQKPEPAHGQLVALVRHRADLTDTRAQARNRRGSPGCQAVAGFLDQQLDFLTQQIKAVDAAIAELIDQQPDLASRRQRLRDIPGVGPVVAQTLLALLPELGQINRRQASSLAGLAPHPDRSGRRDGRRTTNHGRDRLKPMLFLAALAATRAHGPLKTFAQRLAQDGKAKRCVLIATARKIVVIANAKLKPDRQCQLT